MNPQDYFSQYGPIASRATKKTGLFASVMLAQAALESAWGQSDLSKKYKNHFGVKAGGSWKGKSVVLKTGEFVDGNSIFVNDAFRVYENDLDSFKDRNHFLKINLRYTKAGVFDAITPEAQAQALQNAGYATDPVYANKIVSMIEKYDLKQYDSPQASKWLAYVILAIGLMMLIAVLVFVVKK